MFIELAIARSNQLLVVIHSCCSARQFLGVATSVVGPNTIQYIGIRKFSLIWIRIIRILINFEDKNMVFLKFILRKKLLNTTVYKNYGTRKTIFNKCSQFFFNCVDPGPEQYSEYGIRIRIQQLLKYGFNLDPDPQHWLRLKIRVGHRVLFRSVHSVLFSSLKGTFRSFPFFFRVFGDL